MQNILLSGAVLVNQLAVVVSAQNGTSSNNSSEKWVGAVVGPVIFLGMVAFGCCVAYRGSSSVRHHDDALAQSDLGESQPLTMVLQPKRF